MTRGFLTEQYLSDIADAIREKNGGVTKYRPIDMAEAIRRLEMSETAGAIRYKGSVETEEELPEVADEGWLYVIGGKTFAFWSSAEDAWLVLSVPSISDATIHAITGIHSTDAVGS